ncbi:MAG: glycosyltransferase family 9 protein [Ferruginibacter sp.]
MIRFSSMGDVAMTVPVIKNLLVQNQQLRITVVSNHFLQPLFDGLERCHFHPAFLKGKHKGLAGLLSLQKELKKQGSFDAIADLHNVLRSTIITNLFRLSGHTIAVLDKGRAEKKLLTQKKDKVFRQLTPMHERYAMVFRNIGLPLQLETSIPVYDKKIIPDALNSVFVSGKKIIAVAPFAQYKEKMYPLEKMKMVVQQLAANNIVLLFGGGKNEAVVLQEWEMEIFSVFNVANRYSFADELAIISNVDVMISMDSANMHLASLFNVPVVSIWGATHRFAGFYGWAQEVENIAEIELYCRPCSVFGNKPCYRGDHACMNTLNEDLIVKKVKRLLEVESKIDNL